MAKEYSNIGEAFWDRVQQRAHHPCYGEKVDGKWRTLSWMEVGEKVARLASSLKKMGLKPGEPVAMFSDNCPGWAITDFAAISAGLVSVPIYPTQTDAQVKYIIEHSEARVAVARGKERIQKLLKLESLQKIITIDAGDLPAHPKLVSFDDFLRQGAPDTKGFAASCRQIDPKSLSTIVYTSGTTANPKGVMLTHGNTEAQSTMLAARAIRTPNDVVLSYLPLSHITERANLYRQARTGYAIYFSTGFDYMAQELKEVRPTSFVAVPRVWEKFQEGIQMKVAQAPEKKRAIFEKLQKLGREVWHARQEGKFPVGKVLRLRLLQKIVGKKIKQGLGLDRCKIFVSGAAPASLDTLLFFYSLGMPIVEGYGLTECAGGSHMNLRKSPVFGTVGPNLDGLECKLANDGEILMRGNSIFVGYFKEPELTAETLKNGWLHTGDIGRLDEKGNLTITDRKKNIIVTSGGKNVAPAPLEAHLKRHPLVSQAVVIGDKRKYLTALITLPPGVDFVEAKTAIDSHIAKVNSQLPSYETIKKFSVLERDFSVEAGELTPTLKTKRGFIQEKYKNVIDNMYQE